MSLARRFGCCKSLLLDFIGVIYKAFGDASKVRLLGSLSSARNVSARALSVVTDRFGSKLP